MSRRESRDSESRRNRSRFDQEPCPKRYRRDRKPETERPPTETNLDSRDPSEREQKHPPRLQDKCEPVRKESDRTNVNHEGTKPSMNPTEVPRSRSYFQSHERGSSGQANRSFSHRAATGKERGCWRDPKEEQNERSNRISTGDMQKTDKRSRDHREERGAWRHDRYSEMEADPKPPARKIPSFSERKIPVDSEKVDNVIEESLKMNGNSNPVPENDKRLDRGGTNPRHLDRSERNFPWDREANEGESWSGNFSSRVRVSSRNGNYLGRERFMGRQGYRPPMGGRVEKWKHDLYDKANKSPSPKNEEDVVAKVEALLAS